MKIRKKPIKSIYIIVIVYSYIYIYIYIYNKLFPKCFIISEYLDFPNN